ncbi:hypothetical protein DRO02_02210 [archaeon]|nr:MAG: hypothetical protein DRO21_02790 [archaeon]RLG65369.1 MAG: hypothetical protein DRO02_02210 [archaeon]HDM23660.1 hypothetical protein [Candidatus Bathyarchaeota archaeon]
MNKNITLKLLKTIENTLRSYGILYSHSLNCRDNIIVGMLNSNNVSKIPSTTLKKVLEEIVDKCNETVEQASDGNYEIIKREVTGGAIINNGKMEAKILRGYILECYIFKLRRLIFLRIEVDRTLWKPVKTWISVDIDEIIDSPWFD